MKIYKIDRLIKEHLRLATIYTAHAQSLGRGCRYLKKKYKLKAEKHLELAGYYYSLLERI